MHVLKSYRQAYPYPRGILGHITEAEEMIRSGRIAVSTVKDEIERKCVSSVVRGIALSYKRAMANSILVVIWDRNRRAIHDDVFK